MISAAKFESIFPHCPKVSARVYLPLLLAAMIEFGITSRRRAAAFFGQVGEESRDLSRWEEDLNYKAARLCAVWPKRFPNTAASAPYAHNPQALANKIYGGRMGNTRAGDGWKFRGRCPLQATGREMYAWLADVLKLPLLDNPDLLLEPRHGFRAAAAIFAISKNCNKLADLLSGEGDPRDLHRFDNITYRINGGYNGRGERQQRYLDALGVLSDADFQNFVIATPTIQQPSITPTPSPALAEVAPVAQIPQVQPASQSQSAPVDVVVMPAESSLLDEIPVNDNTKQLGGSVLRRLGVRLGVATATLWSMGTTGRLLLALVAVALAALVYFERKPLTSAARKLLRKL